MAAAGARRQAGDGLLEVHAVARGVGARGGEVDRRAVVGDDVAGWAARGRGGGGRGGAAAPAGPPSSTTWLRRRPSDSRRLRTTFTASRWSQVPNALSPRK